ncbi:hypothetical protein Ddye_023831 [Dipteronia dyeriana]|uniref:LOB domain-containing protein n=1 Tax=Dipteronia dyeriana TaxID=168575 RepID=A0AAD9TUQ3_9ROSI|nr:hypothetical protein Ddye_023831 [Dipteronia dyeriana]
MSGCNSEDSSISKGRYACAACKHQRRKCKLDCVLAPYFPSNRSREFDLVLELYGVGKVTKLLKKIEESHREEAVRSLLWEAESWYLDPAHGPLGLYTKLHQENETLKIMLKQLQHQNQVFSYGAGTSSNPVPNNAMFNQNCGSGSQQQQMMSNYTGFVQNEDIKMRKLVVNCSNGAPQGPQCNNTDMLHQQVNRGLAIVEPSNIAASHDQYLRNIATQFHHQGRDFVAQGNNYDDHNSLHYPVSTSLQGFNNQGRGSATTNGYTHNPNCDINDGVQESCGYCELLQQQQQRRQQQLQQHMSNTHHR